MGSEKEAINLFDPKQWIMDPSTLAVSNPRTFWETVEGTRESYSSILQRGYWWIGIHGYDKHTRTFQLFEGVKETRCLKSGREIRFERGFFRFIDGLKRWELVEGVKRRNGEGKKKKIRGKWIYHPKENKMICVKFLKECNYRKCERNSDSSKRVFKLCGKCKKTFYCSRRHQRNDWKFHKYMCSFY